MRCFLWKKTNARFVCTFIKSVCVYKREHPNSPERSPRFCAQSLLSEGKRTRETFSLFCCWKKNESTELLITNSLGSFCEVKA